MISVQNRGGWLLTVIVHAAVSEEVPMSCHDKKKFDFFFNKKIPF